MRQIMRNPTRWVQPRRGEGALELEDEPASIEFHSPIMFRAQVRRLLHSGYRPINARDLARGRVDVPAGTTPAGVMS